MEQKSDKNAIKLMSSKSHKNTNIITARVAFAKAKALGNMFEALVEMVELSVSVLLTVSVVVVVALAVIAVLQLNENFNTYT